MNFLDFINEQYTKYKIEKWNNEKQNWEFLKGYFHLYEAKIDYTYLLKNCVGQFRIIKVIEIDER